MTISPTLFAALWFAAGFTTCLIIAAVVGVTILVKVVGASMRGNPPAGL